MGKGGRPAHVSHANLLRRMQRWPADDGQVGYGARHEIVATPLAPRSMTMPNEPSAAECQNCLGVRSCSSALLKSTSRMVAPTGKRHGALTTFRPTRPIEAPTTVPRAPDMQAPETQPVCVISLKVSNFLAATFAITHHPRG